MGSRTQMDDGREEMVPFFEAGTVVEGVESDEETVVP